MVDRGRGRCERGVMTPLAQGRAPWTRVARLPHVQGRHEKPTFLTCQQQKHVNSRNARLTCQQQKRTFLNARFSIGDAGDEGGASEAWLRSLMSLLVQHPPHNYSFGPQEDLFVQVPPFPPPLPG